MEWQPIESVPTDGTIIDIWAGVGNFKEELPPEYNHRFTDCFYQDGKLYQWVDGETKRLPIAVIKPTHWRNIPQPPTTKEVR